MEEQHTKAQRTLAYHVATIIDEEELNHIFGGAGPFVIPTIVITGAPLMPDSARDNH